MPDQFAARGSRAVADLGRHGAGQLGHLGHRHRRQVPALPGQLDHPVPLGRAVPADTARLPLWCRAGGAVPCLVRGADLGGQTVPFGPQPGPVGFQPGDPGGTVLPDLPNQVSGVVAGLLKLGPQPVDLPVGPGPDLIALPCRPGEPVTFAAQLGADLLGCRHVRRGAVADLPGQPPGILAGLGKRGAQFLPLPGLTGQGLRDGLPRIGADPVQFGADLDLGGACPVRLAAGLLGLGWPRARRPHPAGRRPG